MKKYLKTVKELWNVYGGLVLSTSIAWANDFSKGSMDTTTSYIVLSLTCISVLTFLKITLLKKKVGAVENSMLQQKSLKAMKTALNPTENGEKIGNTLIETIEISRKVGNTMKNWIMKNKGAITTTIVAILTIVACVCTKINNEFATLVTINGYNVIAIVGGVATIVAGLFTQPFTSTKVGEAIDSVIKTIKASKDDDKAIVTTVKKRIGELETNAKLWENQIERNKATIRKVELLSKIENYTVAQDEIQNYELASKENATLIVNLEAIKKEIENLKAQLVNLK